MPKLVKMSNSNAQLNLWPFWKPFPYLGQNPAKIHRITFWLPWELWLLPKSNPSMLENTFAQVWQCLFTFFVHFFNCKCLFTTGESGSVTSRAFGNLTIIKCDENEFTCTKDGSCIDETKRCNLFQDCPNNEDELNCRK